MRFMLIAKATPQSEGGAPPNPKLFEAIGKLTEGIAKAGILVGTGGLMPSTAGARVSLKDGRISVTDGPFAETKEMIAGYAIVDVQSREEAIELSRQFMQVHADIMGPGYEGESEVRQMFMGPDCAPAKP